MLLLRLAVVAMVMFVLSTCRRSPPPPAPAPVAVAPSTAPTDAPGRRIEFVDGLLVYPDAGRVEVPAIACLDVGWLEQVACSPDTREYESLLVIGATPSTVHAAMLMAGLEPGTPGRWAWEEDELRLVAPQGTVVDLRVRYDDAAGETVEEPIRTWIREHGDEPIVARATWVFGGSSMQPNPPSMGEGEHYVADMTGSIVGLVTFGDEVIGLSTVRSDSAEFQEALWEVASDRVPRPGTPVTLIIERAR